MRFPSGPVVVGLLLAGVLPPMGLGQQDACVSDLLNDHEPQTPPGPVSGFDRVDLVSICLEEQDDLFIVVVQPRDRSAPGDGQAVAYEISLRIGGDPQTCRITRSPGSDALSGCAGAQLNLTTSPRLEIPRGALGVRAGVMVSNVSVTATGSYQGGFTSADRAPQAGTAWTAPYGFVVGSTTPGVDSDRDGINDAVEVARGTDPSHPDTDRDGLLDGRRLSLRADSPAVAMLDAAEIRTHSRNATRVVFVGDADVGGDPLRADTDGDGLLDGWDLPRTAERDAAYASQKTRPLVADGPPARYLGEQSYGARARDVDSDGDLVWDPDELLGSLNHDFRDTSSFAGFPGSTRPGSRDSDEDGLNDTEELSGRAFVDGANTTFSRTDPNDNDTDDDGLSDYDEVLGQYVRRGQEPFDFSPSDPLRRDTDGDGYDDLFEVLARSGPTDASDVPFAWGILSWLLPLGLVLIVAGMLVLRAKRR